MGEKEAYFHFISYEALKPYLFFSKYLHSTFAKSFPNKGEFPLSFYLKSSPQKDSKYCAIMAGEVFICT